MGLLYGRGYPDATITIAARCGQDSDCNPSNAGGILFTTIGYKDLPNEFKSALNSQAKFSHTPYNFPTLVKVCQKLARQAVVNSGGRTETDAKGSEFFVIPQQQPKPSALEQCWSAGPISNSRFTENEVAQITATAGKDLSEAIGKFAPGWKVSRCGQDMDPGLRAEQRGRKNVLVTHPLDQNIGCIISRKVELPAGKRSTLKLEVGHDPRGDWDLIVKANGTQLLRKTVGPDTAQLGWLEVEVDLSRYAGKNVELELINQATGWHYEAGLWAEIALITE
jgi:hypothetical protein